MIGVFLITSIKVVMDKIRRFVECFVPATTCNLRCHYCYITHTGLFANKPPKFKYGPEHVRKAMSKERLGGVCLINLCAGGETLLAREIIGYIRAFLEEGHYVMVVTNATISKRFDELASFPKELLERLFFKFSYHYLELKNKNKLDTFFLNVKKMQAAGASFTVEITPSDELIPHIEEVKRTVIEQMGALPHVTVARDERDPQKLPILTSMNREKYADTWSSFDSTLFRYKMSIFEVKRKEFCYAGEWSFVVNLGSGLMRQCYLSLIKQNIFEDISRPIKFTPIGSYCLEHHCFNGHAWITLGDIPRLSAPTYAEVRNRVCIHGGEWLTPKMKEALSQKLYETNTAYSQEQEKDIDRKNRLRFLFHHCKRIVVIIIKKNQIISWIYKRRYLLYGH
jgi:organic radical activating enzyme